uniref:Kinetochore protein SPC25 n=1 Tax=Anthurium amnicola TaxID=1678845 RepID=A0A1D1Z4M4_9ARAE
MQGEVEKHPVHRKMEDLRLACDRAIRAQRQKASEAAAAFRRSLFSIRAREDESAADGEKLANSKAYLRELENDLRETVVVKGDKVAKNVATRDSLLAAKARAEELRKIVQELKAKKDEYEAIISVGLETLNQDSCRDSVDGEDLEDAILWYDKVLGFQTEGGEGVRFIFDKIDLESPDKEYSFSIRLDDDTYRLLQCEPYVEDIEELLAELNQSNGLFKFVRTMREKFQAAAQNGTAAVHPESSTITISSPPPASTDSRSDSSNLQNDPEVLPRENRYHPLKEVDHVRAGRQGSQTSNISASRRSPRLRAKHLLKN